MRCQRQQPFNFVRAIGGPPWASVGAALVLAWSAGLGVSSLLLAQGNKNADAKDGQKTREIVVQSGGVGQTAVHDSQGAVDSAAAYRYAEAMKQRRDGSRRRYAYPYHHYAGGVHHRPSEAYSWRRFYSDQSLWRPGAIVDTLPPGAAPIRLDSGRCFYYKGLYFMPYNQSYILVEAPRDIQVPYLPESYYVVQQGDVTYFYYHGYFYRRNPANGQYHLAAPPQGALVPTLPPGYSVFTYKNDPYCRINDTYYRIIQRDGRNYFQVIGTLEDGASEGLEDAGRAAPRFPDSSAAPVPPAE